METYRLCTRINLIFHPYTRKTKQISHLIRRSSQMKIIYDMPSLSSSRASHKAFYVYSNIIISNVKEDGDFFNFLRSSLLYPRPYCYPISETSLYTQMQRKSSLCSSTKSAFLFFNVRSSVLGKQLSSLFYLLPACLPACLRVYVVCETSNLPDGRNGGHGGTVRYCNDLYRRHSNENSEIIKVFQELLFIVLLGARIPAEITCSV